MRTQQHREEARVQGGFFFRAHKELKNSRLWRRQATILSPTLPDKSVGEDAPTSKTRKAFARQACGIKALHFLPIHRAAIYLDEDLFHYRFIVPRNRIYANGGTVVNENAISNFEGRQL
jgi:hypothetical protein